MNYIKMKYCASNFRCLILAVIKIAFVFSFTMWELETQANHCRDTHSPWSRSVPLLFFYYLSDWFDSDRFSQQGRIVSCRGYHSYKDVTIDYMVLNDGRHLGVSVLVKLICEGGETFSCVQHQVNYTDM